MSSGAQRTNYRETGGVAGITSLGGAIAAAGSAGLKKGGLIWLNSMSVNTDSTTSAIVIAATQLMYSFYGNVYNSGYKVQPLQVIPIAFSAVNAGSMYMQAVSLRTSDSLALFAPMLSGLTVASDAAFQLLAVVISGP
jgi:hypothetical protein